jgi:hypothetical protein
VYLSTTTIEKPAISAVINETDINIGKTSFLFVCLKAETTPPINIKRIIASII